MHEAFKRRIKTQTVLPSAETAAMLSWALLASGQITMPKVDGRQTLGKALAAAAPVDLAAWLSWPWDFGQGDKLFPLERETGRYGQGDTEALRG